MIRILFICHGNICRSTMAESVFTYLIKERGLEGRFEVDSAATSREEIGNGVHGGTAAELRRRGIPVIPHRARQVTREDYDNFDYLIVMDEENIRGIKRIISEDPCGKIYKLMQFAGYGRDSAAGGAGVSQDIQSLAAGVSQDIQSLAAGVSQDIQCPADVPDVADPWYTGNFTVTYEDVLAGSMGLLDWITDRHRQS